MHRHLFLVKKIYPDTNNTYIFFPETSACGEMIGQNYIGIKRIMLTCK